MSGSARLLPTWKQSYRRQKKSNKTQYNVGENGTYELIVKQTKENLTAKNVVVTDTFVQQEGVKYDTSSLKVLLNKEDITQECKINVEGNQFKIETGKDLTDEDKLVIDYQVNFEKEGQYTNTAVSKAAYKRRLLICIFLISLVGNV